MDEETYEQMPFRSEQLGEAVRFIKENMKVKVLYHKDMPISVEIPTFVELRVVKTDPAGFKGRYSLRRREACNFGDRGSGQSALSYK